ncbi:hypothetical protein NPIL_311831 [Nephila pilipes]|uniref:Uncharacterized protein n=1 Tax=Nephila pilipes TaxID=299642 RepID=A0A8X6NPJ7_NEPPI|nr:hypothetical protein NPIL_311831 [Nephila pilipes]
MGLEQFPAKIPQTTPQTNPQSNYRILQKLRYRINLCPPIAPLKTIPCSDSSTKQTRPLSPIYGTFICLCPCVHLASSQETSRLMVGRNGGWMERLITVRSFVTR